MCSTKRARSWSRNSRNVLRGAYVTAQFSRTLLHRLFPGDQLTCYSVLITSKTRPLILNSSIFCFSLHRPILFHWLFFIFLSDWINWLHNYQYAIRRGVTVSQCWWRPITAIKGYRARLETKWPLWQSTMENRSGSSFPLTTPLLFAGLLTVQSGIKT